MGYKHCNHLLQANWIFFKCVVWPLLHHLRTKENLTSRQSMAAWGQGSGVISGILECISKVIHHLSWAGVMTEHGGFILYIYSMWHMTRGLLVCASGVTSASSAITLDVWTHHWRNPPSRQDMAGSARSVTRPPPRWVCLQYVCTWSRVNFGVRSALTCRLLPNHVSFN